jgi:molybdenum cofactor synthesis domain-containing protein
VVANTRRARDAFFHPTELWSEEASVTSKTGGFDRLTRIDVARRLFHHEARIRALPAEIVPTAEALGRILAVDIVAPIDVPSFDRSAVDGYALKAEDTYGTSPSNAVVFPVIGFGEIGRTTPFKVQRQQAVRLVTGAPLPEGADAVVMMEYTKVIGEGKVEVYRSVAPGRNVSARGEDVVTGTRLLSQGVVVRPQDVGILAAMGIEHVEVHRTPIVAVLSTGNELVDLGRQPTTGQVIDSNRPTLIALVRDAGGLPLDVGIARDEDTAIRSRLSEGLEKADLVLVSGGASVGEHDFTPLVVDALGPPGVLVHGVAMRPGKPTALAVVNGKPVILLPGFPVAAMIAFHVFAKPTIMKMRGDPQHLLLARQQVVKAKVLRRIPSSLGFQTFARVFVEFRNGEYVAEPMRTSGSGVITSMVRANGLTVIPENREGVEAGEEVVVLLLRSIRVVTE